MKNTAHTLAALTILSTGCYSFLQDPIEGESAGTTQGTSTSTASSTLTALSTSGSTSGANGGNSSSSSTTHDDPDTTTTSAASTSHTTADDPPSECPELDPALEGDPCKNADIARDDYDALTNGKKCDNDCTIPKCGDSVFNPRAGEVCDDGKGRNKPDAFCSEDCRSRGLITFVTSKTFDGNLADGDMYGVSNADRACNEAASLIPEISEGESSVFYSWLSVRENDSILFSPYKDFKRSCKKAYFSPQINPGNSRKLIASNFEDLTHNEGPLTPFLANPISTTETGDRLGLFEIVMTGTRADGTPNHTGDCSNFTSPDGAVQHGWPHSTSSDWSEALYISLSCATPSHLFCFEQCP